MHGVSLLRLPRRRDLARSVLVLAMLALDAAAAGAQAPADASAGAGSATRAQLTRLAERAEEQAASPSLGEDARAERRREAAALRQRLQQGDFAVGDVIVLSVPADSALSDTFVVQSGRRLLLPDLPPLSLDGVLRSELRAHLAAALARFLRDTTLRVTPLVRFGVLGEVANPGYFRLPLAIPLSDALMAAGGPTAHADVPRTTVRRGSTELLSREAVRRAMVEGTTLDALGLRSGDEIIVRAKREWGWGTIAQIAAVASGILLGLRAF